MFKKTLLTLTLPVALAFASVSAQAAPTVEMDTSLGNITIELNAEKAPKTVEMYLYNVKHSFYDGTIFHRVIPNFMIQGGGFLPSMEEKKVRTPMLPNEAANGLKNERGTIAMARTADPQSARVQFFINHKDNEFLNYRSPDQRGYGYAVFGKVIKGMDVVDKIAAVPTGNAGYYENVPTTPVVIHSIKITSEK